MQPAYSTKALNEFFDAFYKPQIAGSNPMLDVRSSSSQEIKAMSKLVCYCAVCDKPIVDGDKMGDHKVYKFCGLDYIELAHATCAVADNNRTNSRYWEVNDALATR